MRYAILMMLTATLLGCLSAGARKDIGSASEIKPQQVLVVGKIELIPALQENEQLLNKKYAALFKDKAYVLYDDEKYNINDLSISSNYASGLITIGKTFFLPVDKDSKGNIYFSGGIIVTGNDMFASGSIGVGKVGITTAMRADHIRIPGGIRFKAKNSMKAVYIGTMQLYRDDFNAFTKVRFKNEYKKTASVVRKKFKINKLYKIKAKRWN